MTQNTQNSEQQKPNNWFSSWFDTPYYHILYKNRNDDEAKRFIDNLTYYLNIAEEGQVLDLACGKGRHSIYLNQLGYKVTGLDLSENSIKHASQFANETLQFGVHDMREPLTEQFDVVFNLFTSFGYFDSEEDNLKALLTIKNAINEYGVGVIDFMNVPKVLATMVPNEVITIDEITFTIKRFLADGYIQKEISFQDKGESFCYTEKVKALTLADFEQLMEKADMYLLDVFGNYQLGKYSANADRLILIFK